MKLTVDRDPVWKATQYTMEEEIGVRVTVPDKLFLDREAHEVLTLVQERFAWFVDQLREQLR